MDNLLKPVFGGSCAHLHSAALMAIQQSDTDSSALGPVNALMSGFPALAAQTRTTAVVTKTQDLPIQWTFTLATF